MFCGAACLDGDRPVIHRRCETCAYLCASLGALEVMMKTEADRCGTRDGSWMGPLVAGLSSRLGWARVDGVPLVIRRDGGLRGLGVWSGSVVVWKGALSGTPGLQEMAHEMPRVVSEDR